MNIWFYCCWCNCRSQEW